MNEPTVPLWRVNTEKTKDHWLEVDDGEGWWSAFVKWDGCLEVQRYFNQPWGDGDTDCSLHICEIEDMIARLEMLRDMARRHFGEDWR